MSAKATPDDPSPQPISRGLSASERAALSRMKVCDLERLAYTEAANTKPPPPKAAKRKHSLAKAFYHWVHSRL